MFSRKFLTVEILQTNTQSGCHFCESFYPEADVKFINACDVICKNCFKTEYPKDSWEIDE